MTSRPAANLTKALSRRWPTLGRGTDRQRHGSVHNLRTVTHSGEHAPTDGDCVADGYFLQGNQTFVVWRGGVLARCRTSRMAVQREAIRTAALLARLRSSRSRSLQQGHQFWRELFADLESASREDDIPWEVVFAATEAVQAEVCRTAKPRAAMIQRPNTGLLARVGTCLSRASTPGGRRVMRWSSRRARTILLSAHSSAERQDRYSRGGPPRDPRSFARMSDLAPLAPTSEHLHPPRCRALILIQPERPPAPVRDCASATTQSRRVAVTHFIWTAWRLQLSPAPQSKDLSH
jgi:hypothetical protein